MDLAPNYPSFDAAIRFLRAQGMQLLERELRLGRCRIDLLMRDVEEDVFVVLKFRTTSSRPGSRLERPTPTQLARLAEAATRYLWLHPEVTRVRIDLVTVLRRGYAWEIGYLRNLGDPPAAAPSAA